VAAMSLPRHAAKRDASEPEIVDAFERLGWSVLQISKKGAPDLVVGLWAHLVLVECKSDKGKLTKHQVTFNQGWKGPQPVILRNAEDVVQFHYAVVGRRTRATVRD
jgi:Holliday junction resolvase